MNQSPPASRGMKRVYYIGFGTLFVVAALMVLVATRPDDLHVERTGTVSAPPDVVFAKINDLPTWTTWSPYEGRDPDMKRTYEGPKAGTGAVYGWNGNNDIGEGKMTIIESKPGELVKIRLQFTRPFPCDNIVNFILSPTEGGTKVTWAMDGKNTFFSKAMGLVLNMDAMVGDDFAQGIKNLDAAVKKDAAPATAATPET